MNDTTRPAVAVSTALSTRAIAAGPDAELIALAQEVTDLTRRERGLYGEGDQAHLHIKSDKKRDAVTGPINHRIKENLQRLLELRATTPAGLLARAQMTDFYAPGWWTTDPFCCDEKLAVSLLDDVLAMFATPSPDAPLLALIDRWNALEDESDLIAVEHPEHDVLIDPLRLQQAPLQEAIISFRAVTPEAAMARLRLLGRLQSSYPRSCAEDDQVDGRILGAVIRDALGEPVHHG
jgi:hypothetical protein